MDVPYGASMWCVPYWICPVREFVVHDADVTEKKRIHRFRMRIPIVAKDPRNVYSASLHFRGEGDPHQLFTREHLRMCDCCPCSMRDALE